MLSKIEDIKKALKHECYESALALALTIPDICGQVECTERKSNHEKYMNWCLKYLVSHFETTIYAEDTKELIIKNMVTPNVLYLLRCQFLHSGNECIGDESFVFELTTTGNSMFGMTGESFELDDLTRHIRINIADLCEKICMAATDYYEDSDDKSVFDKYTISPINF